MYFLGPNLVACIVLAELVYKLLNRSFLEKDYTSYITLTLQNNHNCR